MQLFVLQLLLILHNQLMEPGVSRHHVAVYRACMLLI